MGSCVSKKAAGAGRKDNKEAAPLPPVKEISALSPVAEEEEEVKEVVLSETPAPPRPPVEKREEQLSEEGSGSCSESASVGSVAKEKAAMTKAVGGEDQEVVKRAMDARAQEVKARARMTASPEKARAGRRPASPEKSKPARPQQGGACGNRRSRSPSPSSAHRRQMPARREPTVVSGIGCRSGRVSPSAARRAAERAVRRTHSAREADMSLPAKRSLLNASSSMYGHGNAASCFGGGASNSNTLGGRRGDAGERSGRRSDSPTRITSKRPSPAPSPIHRQASSRGRREARDNCGSTPVRSGPRGVRDVLGPDDGEEKSASARGGGEQKKAQEGALGQNPTVAMECFIFL